MDKISTTLTSDVTFFIGSFQAAGRPGNLYPLSLDDRKEYLMDCIKCSMAHNTCAHNKYDDQFFAMIAFGLEHTKAIYVTKYESIVGFYFVMTENDGLYFKMLSNISKTIHDGKDHWEYI